MDSLFHYPPDVFNLLVDTIPRLCKSKQDVLLFFRGAGVPDADLVDMQTQVSKSREAVSKFAIARDVLTKVNLRGEAGLRPRREIIKRVVEFEEFSMCWPSDLDRAKANVADLRRMVQVKDAFTKMQNAHNELQAEKAAAARSEHAAKVAKKRRIADVRDRLNALFAMDSEPQKRGKLLEGVLNDLFRAYGIHIKEDFRRHDQGGIGVVEQLDGIIEFEGYTYLVEMKWLKGSVGVDELSSHFMRLYARPDVRGLFISSSDFANTCIAECKAHAANKTMVLSSLREFVLLLMNEGDLLEMLRVKIRAAVLEKRPFLEITA